MLKVWSKSAKGSLWEVSTWMPLLTGVLQWSGKDPPSLNAISEL